MFARVASSSASESRLSSERVINRFGKVAWRAAVRFRDVTAVLEIYLEVKIGSFFKVLSI